MQAESPTEDLSPVPDEVIIARGVRSHREGLITYTILAFVLAFLSIAATIMAGNYTESAIYVAAIWGVIAALWAALVGAGICFLGMVAALRPSGESASSERQEALARIDATGAKLEVFTRAILIVIVLGLAGCALFYTAGVVGAIIGAFALAHTWAMTRFIRSRCFIAAAQETPQGSRIIPGLQRSAQQ